MSKHQLTISIVAPPGRLRDSLVVLLKSDPELRLLEPADDGQTGLIVFAQHKPKIVIIDTNIPDGQVWDLLLALKNQTPPPRCMVLAHNSGQLDQIRAAGADAVLLAGFNTKALKAAIQSLFIKEQEQPPAQPPVAEQ